jgi:hypothetical protein
LPVYYQSTPATVWGQYSVTEAQIAAGDFNAQMFNSFLMEQNQRSRWRSPTRQIST